MKEAEEIIWNYLVSSRSKGVEMLDAYEALLDGLLEQKEKGVIGREHDLYDVIKEVALLKPEDKFDILRTIQLKMFKDIGRKGDILVLPDELRKLLFDMTEPLFNSTDIYILNAFSGTGSLLDYFIGKYEDARIISQEINTREAELQKKLFSLCDINVKVENVDSLAVDIPQEKYDLIIGVPPFKTDVNIDDVKLNIFDKTEFKRLTVEQAYILKSLESVKDGGIIVGIFASSFLFNRRNKKIRDLILEHTQVLSIIETPRNIFTSTAINAVIVIMKKKFSMNDVEPKNLLMASFSKMKLDSEEFKKEKANLMKEWKLFVEEEVKNGS